MKEKAEVLEEVKSLLSDVYTYSASGQPYARLARAHGYVDGFMRALIDLGFATKEELTELVTVARDNATPIPASAARTPSTPPPGPIPRAPQPTRIELTGVAVA